MHKTENEISFNKTCNICSGNQFEYISRQYNIAKCNRCHFRQRLKVDESISSSYSGDVLMPPRLYSNARSLQQLSFISGHVSLKNVKTILEIGSGSGSMLRLLRNNFPYVDIHTIEPSKPLANILKEIPNINVINSFIEETDLNKRFDLIILSHCLEHIDNPLRLLSHIHDTLLLPKGILFVEVPNPDFELRNELAIKGSPKGHLWYFAPSNLISLLEKIGFSGKSIIVKKVCSSSKLYILSEDILRKLLLKNGKSYKFIIFSLRSFRRIMLYFNSLITLLNKGVKCDNGLDVETANPFCDNIAVVAIKNEH